MLGGMVVLVLYRGGGIVLIHGDMVILIIIGDRIVSLICSGGIDFVDA